MSTRKVQRPRKAQQDSAVNMNRHLKDDRLWESRAAAAHRFDLSVAKFEKTMGGLLDERYRRADGGTVSIFIPALWVFYAVEILGMDDYYVTQDQLDYERFGDPGEAPTKKKATAKPKGRGRPWAPVADDSDAEEIRKLPAEGDDE